MIAQAQEEHVRRVAGLKEKIVTLSKKFWQVPPLSKEEQELFQQWRFAVDDLTLLEAGVELEDPAEERENND